MSSLDPTGDRLAILHLDTHPALSGGQRQLLLLARGLRARGHGQVIAAPAGAPLVDLAASQGFPVARLDGRGLDPRGPLRALALVRRHRPDLVAAHDPHGLAAAALAARLARPRPAVVAHRRVDFPIRPNPLSRWKYGRGADRLVAVSRRVRDVLLAGGVPAERIAVVPDAVEEPSGAPPCPSLWSRVGAPPGAPLVITLAALLPRKDPLALVEAAGRLAERDPAPVWVVCGEGPLLARARAAARARGVGGRIRFPGFLADARALLAEAEVFVLASRAEALGSSLLEAMAAGLPVVATDVGGVAEAVRDGETGVLVPPGDPAALAAAVDRLLDDPARARDLGRAGARRARAFSPVRMVEGTLAAYHAALRRGAEQSRAAARR